MTRDYSFVAHDMAELLGSLFARTPFGVAVWDSELRYLHVNAALARMTGLTIAEHLGRRFDEVLPDLAAEVVPILHRVLLTAEPAHEVELTMESAAQPGHQLSRLASYCPLSDGAAGTAGVGAIVSDLTGQRKTKQRLEADAERYRALVQTAPIGLLGVDERGRIAAVNARAESMFGYDPGGLSGQPVELVMPEAARVAAMRHTDHSTLLPPGPAREHSARRKDGTEFPVEVSLSRTSTEDGLFVAAAIADVSERKGLEGQLVRQALHDALTGLPNRALVVDRIAVALRRGRRRACAPAVLFFDLDRFKQIHDSLGHGVGDQLLIAVAVRLVEIVRSDDTVARIGGDEFVVLCEDASEEEVLAIAKRIMDAFAMPFALAGQELVIDASMGVAFARDPNGTPERLMREAAAAMYHAKPRGGSHFAVFDPMMTSRAPERLRAETALRRAIDEHELRILYQPLVDLSTMEMTGVEALVRWDDPKRGRIPPDDFIPLAEETGLIVPLGTWVLREACRQAAAWTRRQPEQRALTVAVNLSAVQFAEPDLVDVVQLALDDSGADPAQLCLEVTESMLMLDYGTPQSLLAALKRLGMSLAIDDFGTGYCSLGYLRHFDVDTLKIDRSFIEGLGRRSEDRSLVAAITGMSHSLGLSVTAEGVETAEQLAELQKLGCDWAQGFYFAAPQSAGTITRWRASALPVLLPERPQAHDSRFGQMRRSR